MRLIIDAHLDLAWNALAYDRDITRPVEEARRREAGMSDDKCRGNLTVTLPELRRAGVAVCIGTLLARSGPVTRDKPTTLRTDIDYATPAIAHAVARGQLAYYELLEQQGEVRILRTRQDLDVHWSSWTTPHSAIRNPRAPIGIILGMECADPITDPGALDAWHHLGLRNIEPAHFGHSHYAAGTATPGGLTPMGLELLTEMQRLKMMLDLTHLSDQSISEALDVYDGVLLASHHNCRALCPGDRQLSDEHVRRLIARGGVIGAAIHNGMLHPDWKIGHTPRSLVTFDTVANHIDHVCQIAGDSLHSAIGSDLDGGYGVELCPHGLDTIADLHRLEETLDKRGYGTQDLDNIFHANWLRLFRQALPE